MLASRESFLGGNDSCSLDGNRRNETIAATRHSLDKARVIGVVAHSVAQLLDSYIQATVKLDKSILRPKLFPQFLSGNDLPRPLQQQNQHAEGLVLQGHVLILFRELS
jgi:hypothetical protein